MVQGLRAQRLLHARTRQRQCIGERLLLRFAVQGVQLGRTQLQPLADAVNSLLASPMGRRDWPLRFYTPDLLFSVPARRKFAAPDLAPLPEA